MNNDKDTLDQLLEKLCELRVTFRNQADLLVTARIKGWRRVYGRLEYKVCPAAGEGEVWVSANHVEL